MGQGCGIKVITYKQKGTASSFSLTNRYSMDGIEDIWIFAIKDWLGLLPLIQLHSRGIGAIRALCSPVVPEPNPRSTDQESFRSGCSSCWFDPRPPGELEDARFVGEVMESWKERNTRNAIGDDVTSWCTWWGLFDFVKDHWWLTIEQNCPRGNDGLDLASSSSPWRHPRSPRLQRWITMEGEVPVCVSEDSGPSLLGICSSGGWRWEIILFLHVILLNLLVLKCDERLRVPSQSLPSWQISLMLLGSLTGKLAGAVFG